MNQLTSMLTFISVHSLSVPRGSESRNFSRMWGRKGSQILSAEWISQFPARSVWSAVALWGKQIPQSTIRYRNAFLSLGAIVSFVGLSDLFTSYQLQHSTPFRYSLERLQQSPEVQAEIGTPISAGFNVHSKRKHNLFLLTYTVLC